MNRLESGSSSPIESKKLPEGELGTREIPADTKRFDLQEDPNATAVAASDAEKIDALKRKLAGTPESEITSEQPASYAEVRDRALKLWGTGEYSTADGLRMADSDLEAAGVQFNENSMDYVNKRSSAVAGLQMETFNMIASLDDESQRNLAQELFAVAERNAIKETAIGNLVKGDMGAMLGGNYMPGKAIIGETAFVKEFARLRSGS